MALLTVSQTSHVSPALSERLMQAKPFSLVHFARSWHTVLHPNVGGSLPHLLSMLLSSVHTLTKQFA